jgi:hypothetical protein
MVTARCAVRAGIPRQAPSSNEISSGNKTACCAGSTTNSAAVPNGRFHCAFQVQTRCPTRLVGTPRPTRSMIPGPIAVGITRGNVMGRSPSASSNPRGSPRSMDCEREPRQPQVQGRAFSPTWRTSPAGPIFRTMRPACAASVYRPALFPLAPTVQSAPELECGALGRHVANKTRNDNPRHFQRMIRWWWLLPIISPN